MEQHFTTRELAAKHEKRKETVKEVLQVLAAKELTVSDCEEVLEISKYLLTKAIIGKQFSETIDDKIKNFL